MSFHKEAIGGKGTAGDSSMASLRFCLDNLEDIGHGVYRRAP